MSKILIPFNCTFSICYCTPGSGLTPHRDTTPPHICMQTLTFDYQDSTRAGYRGLSYLRYTNFPLDTLINHLMLSPISLIPHLVVLVNSPDLGTFQNVPQMTPFCQCFHVGKLPHSVWRFHLSDKSPHFASTWMLENYPILSDVFTCPTNHPISPTFACWLILLFYQCFNLSHKRPHFANIFMLVNSAVCGTFVVIPVFGQIDQHFHKWFSYFVRIFDDFTKYAHPSPIPTFTPHSTFCNNFCLHSNLNSLMHYQHLLVNLAVLPTFSTCPTNDPILPTFSCWLIRLFVGRF